MRKIVSAVLLALLAVAPLSRAGAGFLCCKTRCTVPPPQPCPSCPDACDHRLNCTLCSEAHARKLVQELACDNSCKRIHIVKKLGCRLHADVCRESFVLDALLHALQCDPCWGVRRTAAWSLMHQNARTEPAVLALYMAARLDPHYMVRIRAAEALDILTLGKGPCYQELYKAADQLIVVLRVKGYQPGRDCALITASTPCNPLAISTTLPESPAEKKAAPAEEEKVPVEQLPPPTPAKPPEKLPLPKP
jgi:hypothetical protein